MSEAFDMKKNKKLIEKFRRELLPLKELKGGLMPVLQLAQRTFGYLPKDILEIISYDMNKPLSEVYGVATFYSAYSLEPKGRYNVDVCTGTSCYSLGGEKILKKVQEILGIKVGEKTADSLFHLASSKCHGLCALSPVMTVNDDVYVNVKLEDVEDILSKYREGQYGFNRLTRN